ncbi:MAG: hypothetical protein FJW40_13595 [Acidobacteria bacterium]|nr:hypothetical protein [Acidobacteriota bacterium]
MTELQFAYRQLARALDDLAIPYAIGGSIASAAFGIARATLDVDLVADLTPDQALALAQRLESEFAVDPMAARNAIASRRPFNAIHLATAFKFDIFPASYYAHGKEEIRRRRMMSNTGLLPDGEVPVVSPEDIILAKLAWYRDGGGASERQWRDLESVWSARNHELDAEYLEKWANEMGTLNLLRRLTG